MPWAQKVTLLFIAFIAGFDELLLGPILTPIGNDLPVRPEIVALFVPIYSQANAAVRYALACCRIAMEE